MCSSSDPFYQTTFHTTTFHNHDVSWFDNKPKKELEKNHILYNRGGQLVFDWDRLENFLITRDRPGGYKVTNTKYHEMQRFSFLFTFWNIDWKCSF